MKTFYFTAIFATILFISNTAIQAQPKPTNPANTNQFELIKQLHSNLPPEIKQPFDENKHQLPQGFENFQNPEILKAEKTNRLKSAKVDGQQLDSVITENWIDSLSQWRVAMKEEFLYDENGKTFSSICWWNETNRQWIDCGEGGQYISINDSSGSMTESRFFIQCGERMGCWECNFQTTYDSIGNIILDVQYTRQDSTEQWQQVSGSKSEYNYNANGKTTLRIGYQWTNSVNQWVASLKEEYIYDGNIIYYCAYEWDSKTNLWVVLNNKQKFECTYDTCGNQTLRLTYFWDVSSTQWILKYKTENTYDTNGYMTSEGGFLWDKNKNQWVFNLNGGGFGKNEWAYDSNGNIILNVFYQINNQFIPYCKYEYAYDASGNKTLSICSSWVDSTNQWIVNWKYKKTYFYSDKSTSSIPNTPTPHLTVYPNPVKDFVVFDLPNNSEIATVELYDIQGKKVMQQKLTETKQIAVGHLPKGLYLYRLTDGEKFYTGKLVVE